jgi:hypothetical protein
MLTVALRVTAVACFGVVLASCSSSAGNSGAGSTAAGTSTTSSASRPASKDVQVKSDDPCALLTAKQVADIVGTAATLRTAQQPYDIELAVRNLDTALHTNRAAGYHGHAATCGYSDKPGLNDSNFTGMGITLITDTGSVSSYTALGYGLAAKYDVSAEAGVEAESNPVNNYVAAVLDDKHSVIVYSKQAGKSSVTLSVTAIRKILENLR